MAIASKEGNLFFQVIDQLLRGIVDKVANVRMVTAEGFFAIVTNGECDADVIASKVKPALEQALSNEEDTDCQAILSDCLQAC
jgi:hypothetical protein